MYHPRNIESSSTEAVDIMMAMTVFTCLLLLLETTSGSYNLPKINYDQSVPDLIHITMVM